LPLKYAVLACLINLLNFKTLFIS